MEIEFTVEGAGSLVAHANGKPNDPASFTSTTRVTFQGRCLAILQPTGEAGQITLEASADGLKSAALTVDTTPENLASDSSSAPRD